MHCAQQPRDQINEKSLFFHLSNVPTMSRVAAFLTLGIALGASAASNTIAAPTGADTLTVALLGGRWSIV